MSLCGGGSSFLASPLTLGAGQPDFMPKFGKVGEKVSGAGLKGVAISFVCDNRGPGAFCTSPASLEPKRGARPSRWGAGGKGEFVWAAHYFLRCLRNLVDRRRISLERWAPAFFQRVLRYAFFVGETCQKGIFRDTSPCASCLSAIVFSAFCDSVTQLYWGVDFVLFFCL